MSDPNQVFPPNKLLSIGQNGQEINLRNELLSMFYGTAQEIAKSHKALLRRIRLDDKGERIKCPCVDSVTNEPDTDYYCPVCLGERYLWDEYLLNCYLVADTSIQSVKSKAVGLVTTHDGYIYLQYDIVVKIWDKIADLNLDLEGVPVQPIKRIRVWQITNVLDYRADNGKMEFIKLTVREEDVRYLNAPDR